MHVMSTWTQLSQGISVPQPANDPASITVLDRPHISWNILQGRDSHRSLLEHTWAICGIKKYKKMLYPHSRMQTYNACNLGYLVLLAVGDARSAKVAIASTVSHAVSSRLVKLGQPRGRCRSSHWWRLGGSHFFIVIGHLGAGACWSFRVLGILAVVR